MVSDKACPFSRCIVRHFLLLFSTSFPRLTLCLPGCHISNEISTLGLSNVLRLPIVPCCLVFGTSEIGGQLPNKSFDGVILMVNVDLPELFPLHATTLMMLLQSLT